VLFSTAYLPPVEYFRRCAKHRIACIELYENYIKQTYRNRCYIYAAKGKFCMSVPVIKTNGNHTQIKDIRIDYTQLWQRLHWRSIESAYNSSPFFLYYRDYFEPLYKKKYTFLIDLNTELLLLLIKLCGVQCEVKFTDNYVNPDKEINDFRNSISPKNKIQSSSSFTPYTQVFNEISGFIPNLSIIDLLFNEGKFSREYF